MSARKKRDKTFLPLKEAISLIRSLGREFIHSLDMEIIPITESLDYKIARDIFASGDSPSRNISSVDGYALKCEDEYPLKVKHIDYNNHHGRRMPRLASGEAVPIVRGAFIPPGANAVIKQNDARISNGNLIGVKVRKGNLIIKKGTDYKKGEKVLKKGTPIRPQEIAWMNKLEIKNVPVYRKYNVGILEPDQSADGDKNIFLLTSFLKKWHCDYGIFPISDDSYASLKKNIRKALKKYDVVLFTGYQPAKLVEVINQMGTVLVEKIKFNPDASIVIGKIRNKLIFALPVAPMGCFTAMNILLGNFFNPESVLPWVRRKLANTILLPEPGLTYVIYVNFKRNKAYPLGYRNSGLKFIEAGSPYNIRTASQILRTSILANGCIFLEKDTLQGEEVKVYLLD